MIYGKHTGDLYREDFPSLFIPSREDWYTPRHRLPLHPIAVAMAGHRATAEAEGW
jgi:hypothetical protein